MNPLFASFLISLFLAYLAAPAAAQNLTVLSPNVFLFNQSAVGNPYYDFKRNRADPTPVRFTIFYCSTEVTMLLSVSDKIPDPADPKTISTQALWTADAVSNAITVLNNVSHIYVGMRGTGSFDFVAGSLAQLTQAVPVPGDAGAVTTTLSAPRRSEFKVTIEFTGTGVAGDTYSLWRYDGQPPVGVSTTAACGLRRWMTHVARNATDLGSNKYQYAYAAGELNIDLIYSFSIIVTRPNGYEAPYRMVIVNSASLAAPAGLLLAAMLLISVLAA